VTIEMRGSCTAFPLSRLYQLMSAKLRTKREISLKARHYKVLARDAAIVPPHALLPHGDAAPRSFLPAPASAAGKRHVDALGFEACLQAPQEFAPAPTTAPDCAP